MSGCGISFFMRPKSADKEKYERCQTDESSTAGYDFRKPDEDYFKLYITDFHWECFSAVLQYGRRGDRRKVRGDRSIGCCGQYRDDHVFDLWIRGGHDGRLHGSDSSEVWSGRHGGNA